MSTKTAAVAAENAKQIILKRYMNPTRVWGYHSGFTQLDLKTGGIQHENPSEYTIVAARSNVGKSAFGMTVALNLAFQFKKQYPDREARICLLEMDAETCLMRLIAQIADIPIGDLRSGFISPAQKAEADKAADVLAGLPLYFLEGSHTADHIRKFVSMDNQETGRKCGWWLLDHIGIVPTQAAMQSNNQSFTLGEMSRTFHAICRRYAPGMVLAQLNRESTKTKDGKPSPTHVYGSDRMLQDADLVLLLDRPELRIERAEDQKDDLPNLEVAQIIIAKNRNGELKDIEVGFARRQALWTDLPEAPKNAA